MPVPFDTVEIENGQIFIIKLERIESASVLSCLLKSSPVMILV